MTTVATLWTTKTILMQSSGLLRRSNGNQPSSNSLKNNSKNNVSIANLLGFCINPNPCSFRSLRLVPAWRHLNPGRQRTKGNGKDSAYCSREYGPFWCPEITRRQYKNPWSSNLRESRWICRIMRWTFSRRWYWRARAIRIKDALTTNQVWETQIRLDSNRERIAGPSNATLVPRMAHGYFARF